MKHKITRRDFINGVAIGAGAGFLNPISFSAHSANVRTDAPYPPLRSGMRGNHPGSYDAMHALAWNDEKPAGHKSLNEHYDLVVVGAGVSGLAAAHFFQKTKRKKQKFFCSTIMMILEGMQSEMSFTIKAKPCLVSAVQTILIPPKAGVWFRVGCWMTWVSTFRQCKPTTQILML